MTRVIEFGGKEYRVSFDGDRATYVIGMFRRDDRTGWKRLVQKHLWDWSDKKAPSVHVARIIAAARVA